jgi:hypothetical protein
MSEEERDFYNELNVYLMDGFALAKQQGGKGRALGFVMTIFQKIAASSFAAVHRTLRRRLIALTIQEGLVHDSRLDIEARDAAFAEARKLISKEFQLLDDRLGQIESERILADLKRRIVKRMDDDELAMLSSEYSSESETASSEDTAVISVAVALPEERQRITDLLAKYPPETETKVKNLIKALGTLWQQDSSERVVIFATYLGSVEMLGEEIEKAYPGQGVVVLKGGDHGSKLAAEKRFKLADGPRVMICTAAGREGINLQHARILFNFDLPWNPMDLEQRIGRIHRYGQRHTAQVYNLVLSDTIEGKIFLLLDDKLTEIAKALGKVDESGEVAEDLRSQILGQLSEQLNYESLYAKALSDPELRRTRLELDAAMSNAKEARDVVFELFQDLDRFTLDEYAPLSNVSDGMERLVDFMKLAAEQDGKQWREVVDGRYELLDSSKNSSLLFTTNRDDSLQSENISLLGLDHPVVEHVIRTYRELPTKNVGIRIQSPDGRTGIVSVWLVTSQGERGESQSHIIPVAVGVDGNRIPSWERSVDQFYFASPCSQSSVVPHDLLLQATDSVLRRELLHRQFISDRRGYDAKLIGWCEVVGDQRDWDVNSIQEAVRLSTKVASNEPRSTSGVVVEDLGFGDSAKSMRAISIRQPFVEAILRGLKTTEFRSGPTNIRGRILLYASLGRYSDEDEQEMLLELGMNEVDLESLPRGAIVGSVELYDSNGGEWYLRNPQRAKKPVEPINRPNPVWFYPFDGGGYNEQFAYRWHRRRTSSCSFNGP